MQGWRSNNMLRKGINICLKQVAGAYGIEQDLEHRKPLLDRFRHGCRLSGHEQAVVEGQRHGDYVDAPPDRIHCMG